MGKNKDDKKRWIICLIVLDILLVLCIVFLYLYAKNIDNNSLPSIIEDIEENGVHTTIYIISHLSNKIFFYLYSLVLITIDLIILTVILIMEYIKNKKIKLINGIIITILSNIIIAVLLFPQFILFMLILNMVIITAFLVKYLFEKKLNRTR